MECPLGEPSLTFRKYQNDVLEQVKLEDKEMLIVAPPGSGKTIIGLELIKRLGAPAVVFSPTTIIAKQWKEKCGFFCKDPDKVCALEAEELKFINIFTYQRISTRSEATEAMEKMARGMWAKELQKNLSPEEAEKEIQRIEKKDREYYEKKVGSFVSRLRREYDREVISRGLHKNAVELVGRLKEAGVKTIILDECHHLLEYWGLVIEYLKEELGATVIGLTATYPIAEEKDVFFEIFTEQVDYEVSVPAVVKEGFLAPYRELAYIVTPTDEEVELIKSDIRRVDNAFSFIAAHRMFPEFCGWVQGGEMFKDNYPLYELIVRNKGKPLEMNYDEKVLAMKGFLDYAYPIMGEEDRNNLFHVLKSNGISYLNRVLNVARTVERYVLSYSENRINGALEVLKKEASFQGDKLRALVLADFDVHVPAGRVKPGREMGSATLIFARMVKALDELNEAILR